MADILFDAAKPSARRVFVGWSLTVIEANNDEHDPNSIREKPFDRTSIG
jgi:hypothetical protein